MSKFSLTKQVHLFTATWREDELRKLPNSEFVQDDDTLTWVPTPFPPHIKALDVWGIPWSAVPDAAWREDINYHSVSDYEVAYLRFTVSVGGGRPGDGVLFRFNSRARVESGLHAQVHVEVVGEVEPASSLQRSSTSIAQCLIGGYYLPNPDDRAHSLAEMKAGTLVQIMGLYKQSGVSVTARCDLLGGFERSR